MKEEHAIHAIAALKRAIEIFGTQTLLAKEIGCSQQNISKWLRGRGASGRYAPIIEKKTKKQIKRNELRPDFEW